MTWVAALYLAGLMFNGGFAAGWVFGRRALERRYERGIKAAIKASNEEFARTMPLVGVRRETFPLARPRR